jgi:hypothetical protein
MSVMPVLINCSIEIDSAEPNGTKNLKGGLVQSIKKQATGVYAIQLQDNYNKVYNVLSSIQCPSTGSTIVTSVTAGQVCVIKTLGNTTQAQWEAMGLPVGITAAIGAAFAASAAGVGTGTVAAPVTSAVDSIEVIGLPNSSISSVPLGNAQILIRTSNAGTAANIADGSILNLSIILSNSSVLIAGE